MTPVFKMYSKFSLANWTVFSHLLKWPVTDHYFELWDATLPYHKVFHISKEVTKVNMEQVTRCGHHNVIIMSVSDTLENIR